MMTTEGDTPSPAPRTRRDGRVRFRVVSSEDGLMLRQLLCRRFAELKPQDAADLVKAGGVYINNVRIRLPSVRVAAGERLTVYRAAANTVHLDPKDLRILHRDADFVIIDKPAGVPASSTRASARKSCAATPRGVPTSHRKTTAVSEISLLMTALILFFGTLAGFPRRAKR